MEDKNKIKKLNIPAADLPEVPRKEDGTIDLEAIAIGKTEKDCFIVPDAVMEKYYKELPNGTMNESGTFTAWNKGLLKTLNDEIRRKGAEALNAERAQRRRLSETIDIFLQKKASAEEIEALGLEAGATKQDAMIAAMMARAIEQKDVQAFNSLRDTAGEKPSENINANINQVTPEQLELLEEFKKIRE
jgi:hypothetical protein